MYIHHNHWLAHALGQDLPRNRIITPYVAPHHVEKAVRAAGLNPKTGDISMATTVRAVYYCTTNATPMDRRRTTPLPSHSATASPLRCPPAARPSPLHATRLPCHQPLYRFHQPLRGLKENLILIDDDVPGNVAQHLIRVAAAHNGTAVVVKGYTKDQLIDLYLKAKVTFESVAFQHRPQHSWRPWHAHDFQHAQQLRQPRKGGHGSTAEVTTAPTNSGGVRLLHAWERTDAPRGCAPRCTAPDEQLYEWNR